MDQKYNISDILDAVNKLNQSKPVKKVKSQDYQEPKKISKDDIPTSTLKLIEEAEKNIKN
tara:strand:+ start:205 stop:384 length:180 start_codon:yes stop_codon:yes gene_type:complete